MKHIQNLLSCVQRGNAPVLKNHAPKGGILMDGVQVEQDRAQDAMHCADVATACRLLDTSPEVGAPNHNSSPCTRGWGGGSQLCRKQNNHLKKHRGKDFLQPLPFLPSELPAELTPI